ITVHLHTFPYTTLFRSPESEGRHEEEASNAIIGGIPGGGQFVVFVWPNAGHGNSGDRNRSDRSGYSGRRGEHHAYGHGRAAHDRSEEHTSELQSLRHLV